MCGFILVWCWCTFCFGIVLDKLEWIFKALAELYYIEVLFRFSLLKSRRQRFIQVLCLSSLSKVLSVHCRKLPTLIRWSAVACKLKNRKTPLFFVLMPLCIFSWTKQMQHTILQSNFVRYREWKVFCQRFMTDFSFLMSVLRSMGSSFFWIFVSF